MAFSNIQLQQVSSMMNAWLETNRPPEPIRSRLDLGWRFEGQSVFIYEIRPRWNDQNIIDHYDYAKATWVERSKEWRIYWKRANQKWTQYDALPTTGNLQRLLLEIERDPYGCFKG